MFLPCPVVPCRALTPNNYYRKEGGGGGGLGCWEGRGLISSAVGLGQGCFHYWNTHQPFQCEEQQLLRAGRGQAWLGAPRRGTPMRGRRKHCHRVQEQRATKARLAILHEEINSSSKCGQLRVTTL